MEIRNRAELDVLYPKPQKGILYDSPELLLFRRIAENDPDGAMALFRDRRQFSADPPVVDAPYGRFEGKERIRAFAEGFIRRFEADALRGDNIKVATAYEGSVDLYSLNRDGAGWVDLITATLTEYCDGAWSLNHHTYERDSNLFHWEWVFQIEE